MHFWSQIENKFWSWDLERAKKDWDNGYKFWFYGPPKTGKTFEFFFASHLNDDCDLLGRIFEGSNYLLNKERFINNGLWDKVRVVYYSKAPSELNKVIGNYGEEFIESHWNKIIEQKHLPDYYAKIWITQQDNHKLNKLKKLIANPTVICGFWKEYHRVRKELKLLKGNVLHHEYPLKDSYPEWRQCIVLKNQTEHNEIHRQYIKDGIQKLDFNKQSKIMKEKWKDSEYKDKMKKLLFSPEVQFRRKKTLEKFWTTEKRLEFSKSQSEIWTNEKRKSHSELLKNSEKFKESSKLRIGKKVENEETLKKLSEVHRGKKTWNTGLTGVQQYSSERAKKISESKKGIPSSRQLICIETGEIFKNQTDAHNHGYSGRIADVCNGKRKIASGLHWKWVD